MNSHRNFDRLDLPFKSTEDNFDIFDWYPHYQDCQHYFLNHAQHNPRVQALFAFLNISLPLQLQIGLSSSLPALSFSSVSDGTQDSKTPLGQLYVSLIPYIRRLVATGMDFPGVLQGVFGESWTLGVGFLHAQERQNYLFAAKSGGWASVKHDYDIQPLQTIPFLRSIETPTDTEIETAEHSWSEWLAMEDWMIGPRSPKGS
ncbi:unnamed protein product [Penicillium salamii]|uniref:Ilp is an apoptosis inhibitor n=1 Tax=Penicillium salamii TaxID=1612424 RepID=A0A9W4JDK4_9EURO|nr:unnamed protein product [Penicillium salamii]CAG7976302.1 unnamed protein product [Penicillium salamii]CAG8034317.1 unnamed protein product [Penicillium salamii]CAG8057541.1 unnamed protein product [Penicillium salamii]CAG8102629.1 unnamed protein product [Penicillium salamii]